MSEMWIEEEWLTDMTNFIGTRPWKRITLWSHPMEHPDCRVIDFADVRSLSGRDKAIKRFIAITLQKIIKEVIE